MNNGYRDCNCKECTPQNVTFISYSPSANRIFLDVYINGIQQPRIGKNKYNRDYHGECEFIGSYQH